MGFSVDVYSLLIWQEIRSELEVRISSCLQIIALMSVGLLGTPTKTLLPFCCHSASTQWQTTVPQSVTCTCASSTLTHHPLQGRTTTRDRGNASRGTWPCAWLPADSSTAPCATAEPSRRRTSGSIWRASSIRPKCQSWGTATRWRTSATARRPVGGSADLVGGKAAPSSVRGDYKNSAAIRSS